MPTIHRAGGVDAVGADQVAQLLHRLEQTGLDGDQLCAVVGLDRSRLGSSDARIERQDFRGLFDAAEELSGDPLIGLHAGEAVAQRSLLTYLTMTQATVRDALYEQARFAHLAFDSLRLEIVERPPYTCSEIDLGPMQTHHEIEYLTATWIRPLPEETEIGAHASEVRFAHPASGPPKEYERVLGCPVRFRQPVWSIAFTAEVMSQPIAGANSTVARTLELEAEQRLAVVSSQSLRARVDWVLRNERSRESRTPTRVAQMLGLSVRTLQRRLQEEGTRFREIRDGIRREEAITLLSDPSLRISEVAQKLGFTDDAGFDNAFKRWTGATPRTQRQMLLNADTRGPGLAARRLEEREP